MLRWFLLATLGALAGWLFLQGGPDPRRWPSAAQRELDRMKSAAEEALNAGKHAAQAHEARVERELAEAAGRATPG